MPRVDRTSPFPCRAPTSALAVPSVRHKVETIEPVDTRHRRPRVRLAPASPRCSHTPCRGSRARGAPCTTILTVRRPPDTDSPLTAADIGRVAEPRRADLGRLLRGCRRVVLSCECLLCRSAEVGPWIRCQKSSKSVVTGVPCCDGPSVLQHHRNWPHNWRIDSTPNCSTMETVVGTADDHVPRREQM